MSGHKRTTITINSEDYRRLHDSEKRLRMVEKDYEDVQKKIKSIQIENLKRASEDFEARQQSYQISLQGMDQRLDVIEEVSNLNLANHYQILQEEIQINQVNSALDVWQEVNQALENQSQAVQTMLLEQDAKQWETFRRLRLSIHHMENEAQSKQEVALAAILSDEILVQALSVNYPMEKFAPGFLDQVQIELTQAHSNLENGFSESALSGAQQVFRELTRTRLEIEEKIQQHNLLRISLIDQAQRIFETARLNRSAPAIDMEGNQLGISIDVNLWSSGKYNILARECKNLLTSLQRDTGQLEIEDLYHIHNQLRTLEINLDETIFQARLTVLSSQLRYNMAECVVTALHQQGYELVEGTYEQEDMRNPYFTIMQNLEGSQVVVRLSPIPGEVENQSIDVYSYDQEPRTQHEMRQRANELSTSLKSYGLGVGIMQTVNENSTYDRLPKNNTHTESQELRGHSSRSYHERN